MKKVYSAFWYFLFLFLSCTQSDEIESSPPSVKMSVPKNSVQLGKKLENPYSVKNMKKAYQQLSPQTRAEAKDFEISTTHLYVKFFPQTEEEVSILKVDTTINLYSYPLDYEILEEKETENIYLDHTLFEDKPIAYYAAVKIDKLLPLKVPYEIIEELFIPDEDSDEQSDLVTRSGIPFNENFIERLVDESLKLTGNMDPQEIKTRAKSKWRPSGRITYYDESKKAILGVEGIKVKAKRWFTTHTGFVDANGNFSCNGRFRRKADYKLDFERADFQVRDMEISRNNLRGAWNYHMVRENKKVGKFQHTSAYTYSIIFRAAYHYCYKNIYGLQRPPNQHALRAKIKIDPVNKNTGTLQGKFTNGFFMGISAKHIEIYNHHSPIEEIYATTIHELAHSAHWVRDRKLFNKDIEKIVKESWARGVQYYLTKDVYPKYNGGPYCRGSYTGIVEDLVNEANLSRNSSYYGDWIYSAKSYKDQITGYKLKELEDALAGVITWEQWRNKIKLIKNGTKQHLDKTFAYWNSGK